MTPKIEPGRLLSGRLVTPPLSPRQSQLLDWIIDYSERRGHFPAQREVATAMSVTLSRAQVLIGQLAQRGYVERTHASSRNMALTETAREWMRRQESEQAIPPVPEEPDAPKEPDAPSSYSAAKDSVSGKHAPDGLPEPHPRELRCPDGRP